MLQEFPLADIGALVAFLTMWIGYTVLSEHRTMRGKSLSAVMMRHRLVWMRTLCERDNRITDASLVSALMRSVSFLASTSLVVLGGLVALMGAGEHAFTVYQGMPFAASGNIETFEMKVLLLAVVFVYAFFQFTWSLRQFNYCCIIMGAAPLGKAEPRTKEAFATHAARLQSLAAHSFNRGLRAHYFALAMIAWFVNLWVFLVATAVVVAILYRREFRSKSLITLAEVLSNK